MGGYPDFGVSLRDRSPGTCYDLADKPLGIERLSSNRSYPQPYVCGYACKAYRAGIRGYNRAVFNIDSFTCKAIAHLRLASPAMQAFRLINPGRVGSFL